MNDKFVCEQCQNIDVLEFAYPDGLPQGEPLKCTKCQTGQWHGLFSIRPYDPSRDLVINRASPVGLS